MALLGQAIQRFETARSGPFSFNTPRAAPPVIGLYLPVELLGLLLKSGIPTGGEPIHLEIRVQGSRRVGGLSPPALVRSSKA